MSSAAIGQAFLQSMLSRGALTEEDTRDLYCKIAAAHGGEDIGAEPVTISTSILYVHPCSYRAHVWWVQTTVC